MRPKTYSEDGKYWAIVYEDNYPYYIGPHTNRSKARRVAIEMQAKIDRGRRIGMIYNHKAR